MSSKRVSGWLAVAAIVSLSLATAAGATGGDEGSRERGKHPPVIPKPWAKEAGGQQTEKPPQLPAPAPAAGVKAQAVAKPAVGAPLPAKVAPAQSGLPAKTGSPSSVEPAAKAGSPAAPAAPAKSGSPAAPATPAKAATSGQAAAPAKAAPPAKVEPPVAPGALPSAGSDEASSDGAAGIDDLALTPEPYYYESLGRRDIFVSLISEEYEEANPSPRPVSDELRVVGILWAEKDRFALLETEDGRSLILREGDAVGDGRVASILPDHIVVHVTEYGSLRTKSLPLVQGGGWNENPRSRNR